MNALAHFLQHWARGSVSRLATVSQEPMMDARCSLRTGIAAQVIAFLASSAGFGLALLACGATAGARLAGLADYGEPGLALSAGAVSVTADGTSRRAEAALPLVRDKKLYGLIHMCALAAGADIGLVCLALSAEGIRALYYIRYAFALRGQHVSVSTQNALYLVTVGLNALKRSAVCFDLAATQQ